MHRSACFLAIAALTLASCDGGPSSPEPTSPVPLFGRGGDSDGDGVPDHEHQGGRFTRTVNNPWPPVPEAVVVEGCLQFHSHFKHFDGGNTSRHHIMSQARGVGLVTGARYTFHELFRQDAIYHIDTDHYDTEQTIRWHVISQNNLGNFFATTRQKMICERNVCRVE